MDWWQHALLYLGFWLLGFFTGTQAGVSMMLNKLGKKPPQTSPGVHSMDPNALMAMIGQAKGGNH